MNEKLIFAAGAATGLIAANVAVKVITKTAGTLGAAMFLGTSLVLRPLDVALTPFWRNRTN